MIVQITDDRLVDGRWFLAPQQYTFVRKFDAPISLCKSCTKKYDTQNITFYEVNFEGSLYSLPYDIVSLIPGDTPSSDMRGFQARWNDKVTHDITLKKGEHTDVVKQAEKYLGVKIRNHRQVDGNRLRELKELMKRKGYTEGHEEHNELTEQI